jgi:hypothetical protein
MVKSLVGRRRIDAVRLIVRPTSPTNAIGQLVRPSRAAPYPNQPLTKMPVFGVTRPEFSVYHRHLDLVSSFWRGQRSCHVYRCQGHLERVRSF